MSQIETDEQTSPDRLLRVFGGDPRRAIREETIVCLICRAAFRQITNTHLRCHETTSLGYKERFGYNRRRPLMCGALLRLYTERAIRSRLAARILRRPIVDNPELRCQGGHRPVALEEILNRRDIHLARGASARGLNGSGRAP